MIEAICSMLLVLVGRITAEVYQDKFAFLGSILKPLNIVIIVLAIVAGILILLKIIHAIKGRRQ